MLRTHITAREELRKERRHEQALNEQIENVNADRIKRILAIDKHVDDEEDDIYDIDDPEEGEEGGAYLDDMDLEPYQDDRNEDLLRG